MHMLGVTNGRIRNRPIRLPELRRWNPGHPRPEGDRSGQVEAFVQVEPHPQPCLVDLEEPPEPGTEEPDHPRSGVCEPHLPIALAALARVQRDPCDQELALRKPADAGPALLD